MPTSESATQRSSHVDVRTSRDIHEQATLLDTWNQSYCQISGGQFNGSVDSIWVDGVRFFVERMNRAVLQKGDVGRDRIGVGIPLRLSGNAILCGEIADQDDLHVFSGASGFEYLSPEELVFIGLEFTQSSASLSANEELLIRELRTKLQQNRRVIPIDRAQARYFRSVLRSLFAGLAGEPSLLADPESRASLKRSSVGAVLELLAHPDEQTDSRAATVASNWQLASQARALVEASPDCPMSVIELARVPEHLGSQADVLPARGPAQRRAQGNAVCALRVGSRHPLGILAFRPLRQRLSRDVRGTAVGNAQIHEQRTPGRQVSAYRLIAQ